MGEMINALKNLVKNPEVKGAAYVGGGGGE
jgi:hypothetical protein